MHHDAAAIAAIGITLAIFTPYLIAVWRRTLRPHVISWVIWGLTTMLVAGGQMLAGAGVGATPILLSGILSSAVAVLAMLRRERGRLDVGVSRFDGWCLFVVLGCIPIWLSTGDVRWSMILLTGIDLIGFAPTMRVIWASPQSESVWLYLAFAVRNVVAIIAVESLEFNTVIFPAVIGLSCLCTVVLLLVRRRFVAQQSS